MQVFLPLHCRGATGCSTLVWQHTRPWLCSSFAPFLYPKNQLFFIKASRCRMETNLWDSLPNQVDIYWPLRHQTALAAGAPDPTQRAFGSKGARGHGWKKEALLYKAVASLKLWWVGWCLKMSLGELMGLRVCNKGFNEGKTWREIRCRLEIFRGVSSNASDECTEHPYSLFYYFNNFISCLRFVFLEAHRKPSGQLEEQLHIGS